MKLVINDGYGGFGLSEKALDKWYRLSLKNYRNTDTNELKKLILFKFREDISHGIFNSKSGGEEVRYDVL